MIKGQTKNKKVAAVIQKLNAAYIGPKTMLALSERKRYQLEFDLIVNLCMFIMLTSPARLSLACQLMQFNMYAENIKMLRLMNSANSQQREPTKRNPLSLPSSERRG